MAAAQKTIKDRRNGERVNGRVAELFRQAKNGGVWVALELADIANGKLHLIRLVAHPPNQAIAKEARRILVERHGLDTLERVIQMKKLSQRELIEQADTGESPELRICSWELVEKDCRELTKEVLVHLAVFSPDKPIFEGAREILKERYGKDTLTIIDAKIADLGVFPPRRQSV